MVIIQHLPGATATSNVEYTDLLPFLGLENTSDLFSRPI
jgi:hypothetical protein